VLQRLRITSCNDGPAPCVGRPAVAHNRERTIRRGGLPPAYSQGFVRATPPPVGKVGERLASLQSSGRSARYDVAVEAAQIRRGVDDLLALETLEWDERRRDSDRVRCHRLRATVIGLEVAEQGLAALAVEAAPLEIVRTAVEIERQQLPMRAWHERGRFEE